MTWNLEFSKITSIEAWKSLDPFVDDKSRYSDWCFSTATETIPSIQLQSLNLRPLNPPKKTTWYHLGASFLWCTWGCTWGSKWDHGAKTSISWEIAL